MTGAEIVEKKQHSGSGLGRGKAPLGKALPRRHQRKILRDNIQGVTAPAIRRLARRGGIKRIDGKVYEETRQVLKLYLVKIIGDAVTYTEYARRKTVTQSDVLHACKKNGQTMYAISIVDTNGGHDKPAKLTNNATPSGKKSTKAAAPMPLEPTTQAATTTTLAA